MATSHFTNGLFINFSPELVFLNTFPSNIYWFEVSNRNTKNRYEICSMLAIKTPE